MQTPPPDFNSSQTGQPTRRRLVHWELSTDENKKFKWELLRTDGTSAATVWENGTWHTWDQNGTGGENSSRNTVINAKMEALLSAINQGFIPANDQGDCRDRKLLAVLKPHMAELKLEGLQGNQVAFQAFVDVDETWRELYGCSIEDDERA